MKIFVCSDLHTEMHSSTPSIPGVDVLILAGDIGVGKDVIDWIFSLAKVSPVKHIIFVAGNHEYYGQDYQATLETYRDSFSESEHIHFLEKDTVTIDGWTFAGTTLWSGFNALGTDYIHRSMNQAKMYLSDFRLIMNGDAPFQPVDCRQLYLESYEWLERTLTENDPRKTIIISHFPPSLAVSHKRISQDLLTSYFQANCDKLIEKYQPYLWVYGHNHWSDDTNILSTRLYSNQLGYPGEEGIPSLGNEVIKL